MNRTLLAMMGLTGLSFLSACRTLPPADAFAAADADRDGRLSQSEASDILVTAIFLDFDQDGDDFLSWAEWRQQGPGADLQVFRARDANGDNRVSLDEAKTAADRLHLFAPTWRQADTNGDGFLDRTETRAFTAKFETGPPPAN